MRTRAPLVSGKASFSLLPYDLHVLGLPLAFILSQDQTLHRLSVNILRDPANPTLNGPTVQVPVVSKMILLSITLKAEPESPTISIINAVYQYFNELFPFIADPKASTLIRVQKEGAILHDTSIFFSNSKRSCLSKRVQI